MKICMLLDNRRVNNTFRVEHGLSIYIEFQDKKIVFDTGKSGLFIENAAKMGINIADIDMAIISHAHKDHSGGLYNFLALNNKAPVYMSANATRDYYSEFLFIKKDIGVPKEVFAQFSNRIVFINESVAMNDNICILSAITQDYPLANSNKNLMTVIDGKVIADTFDHELVLVLNDNGKLVIFTGCCHNGIDNIIQRVREHFPGTAIELLIGGFHLMDFPRNIYQESSEHIKQLGERLISYEIDKVYTCHCTGNRAFGLLKEVMGDKLDYFYTGMELRL